MGYDRDQASEEFARWSESYDRCILQWLLFGPSHRVLIRRIQAVAGDRPCRILDVGCGTGQFATRLKAALPRARVWGIDLVSDMLEKGGPRWRHHAGEIVPGARRQRAAAVRLGVVRLRHLRQQLPSLPPPGSRRGRDASRPSPRRPAPDHRRLPRRPLGLVHLRRLRRLPRRRRPPRLLETLPRAHDPRRACKPSPRKSTAASPRSSSARASPPSRSPASPPPTSGSASRCPTRSTPEFDVSGDWLRSSRWRASLLDDPGGSPCSFAQLVCSVFAPPRCSEFPNGHPHGGQIDTSFQFGSVRVEAVGYGRPTD